MKASVLILILLTSAATPAWAERHPRVEFFRGLSNAERNTMRPLVTLQRDAKSTMSLVASTVKAAKPLLAKIDGLCKGKFKALVNDTVMWNRGQPLQVAKDYCGAAANADALLKRGVINAIASRLRQTAEYFDRAVKKMPTSVEGKFASVDTQFLYNPGSKLDKIIKQNRESLALVGLDPKNVVVTSLSNSRQAFIDAVVKHGSKWKYAPPKGYKKTKDKKVAKFYTTPSVYTGNKKPKVLAMHIDTVWEIKQNRLRVPVRRDKHGTVWFRVADSPWCHRHVWYLSQPMVGKKPKGKIKLVANSNTTRFFTACPKK